MNPLANADYRGEYFSDGKHLRKEYVDLWADELGQQLATIG